MAKYADTCECGHAEAQHYRYNPAGDVRCGSCSTCTGYVHSPEADTHREWLETATEEDLAQAEAAARSALNQAEQAHQAAQAVWHDLHRALGERRKQRRPREDELTYALSSCRCGAPLAYQTGANPDAWVCADVLLGRAGGAAATKLPEFAGLPKESGEHDVLPFTFWKVKSDPNRKAR